jgi:hypothetical protein
VATYIGSVTGSATSASSITLDLTALTGGAGTAVETGDLIVVACGWSGIAAGAPAPTTAGYTACVASLYANDARDSNLGVFYKEAGASPDTSVAVNTRASASYGSVAIAQVWRGVYTTGRAASARLGNVALPNAPAAPLYTAGSVVLAIGLGTGDTTPTDFTAPAGYSNQAIVKQAGSVSSAIAAIASKVLTTEQTEDPAAWTGGESTTSDAWSAVTLPLMPAQASPWVSKSSVAAVLGSAGTPGTINRSTVAAVLGSAGTPGTINKSTVATVIGRAVAVAVPTDHGYSVEFPVGIGGLAPSSSAIVTVSRVIGSVRLLAGLVPRDAYASVSRIVGAVKILTGAALSVQVAVGRIIGAVRLRGTPLGSPWLPPPSEVPGAEDHSLPCLSAGGYRYSNSPGLIRTQMESGVVRQRRKWGPTIREATASAVMTSAQLVDMETVLAAVGAGWWNLPMVTGGSAGVPEMHVVRLTGPVSIRALGAHLYEVALPLEIR